LNSNCSNLSDRRNLQEQVKKAFCYQKLFWPFNVWINFSSDLKKTCKFSAFSLEFQKIFLITKTIFSHSRSENFGNKIPILHAMIFLFVYVAESFNRNFLENTVTKVRLFLDRSCSIFSWLKFIVTFSWFYILNEIESTEDRATAI
jgi:hypothetical protein